MSVESRISAALFLLSVMFVSVAPWRGVRADGRVNFLRDIQPLLAEHCYACHTEEQKGGLRLDRRGAALRGGASGAAAIVPGDAASSPLLIRLRANQQQKRMPLGREALPSATIALFERWLEQGAEWPLAAGEDPSGLDRDHWSLFPVARSRLPRLKRPGGTRNSIDAYVVARLATKGLEPSPEADRVTLVRRLYANLHGLLPSPGDVQRWRENPREDWYEGLVDELLASPRYGERWGRHWLDVVRYADSHGFETNRARTNAYRYRDWVVDAFNSDLPYDRFVREQLAGDQLGAGVATGFLVAGPYDLVKSPDIELTLMQRSDELADMVNTTSSTFLGLTVACARCHNHKFDPVLQKDYYSIEAVFSGVSHGERVLPIDPERARRSRKEVDALDAPIDALRQELTKFPLREAVNSVRNVERFESTEARFLRFTISATNSSEPCLDELEVWSTERAGDTPAGGQNVALASFGTQARASGTLPGFKIHQLAHINDGRYSNDWSWISNTSGAGWVELEFPRAVSIDRLVWGRDRSGRFKDRIAIDYVIEIARQPGEWQVVAGSQDRLPISVDARAAQKLAQVLSPAERERFLQLQKEVRALEERRSAALAGLESGPKAYAGTFAQPGPTHRLYRGDPMSKREVVKPDALTVLGSLGLNLDEPEAKRRLALGRWITRGDHPLTARVLVNRLWQHHFGEGIVSTPSDFGRNGAAPSHPQLLDYLADELVESGWSIKHVQRLITTSATYRQSSTPRREALRVDAQNRLLWRFAPRRLEAEILRDRFVQLAGVLDLKMGGPGFALVETTVANVFFYAPKSTFGPSEWRRMVYAHNVRGERDMTFGAFDCPDGGQLAPKRSRSTTALQALNLLNSPFITQQAKLFAARLGRESGVSTEAQTRRAFVLAMSREPSIDELAAAAPLIETHGLPAFCRALFNASELLFVE